MTFSHDNKIQERFTTALHLEEMSEAERNGVLEKFIGLALEAALGRLLLGLSETEQATLELYIDTHRNDENVIEYLLKTYPIFGDLLEEELQALQQEAVTVLS